MQFAQRTIFLCALGAVVLCGVGIWYVPALYFIAYALMNLFAGGRSGVKIFLFLFSLLLGYALLSFVWQRPAQQRAVRIGLLFSLIISGHLLGLFAYIDFLFRYDLPRRGLAVAFGFGEVSATHLLHNHVFKGVVGMVLHWFGAGAYEGADAGLPFVGVVPAMYLYVGGVLFFCAIGIAIRTLLLRVPRTGSAWRALSFTTLYVLCVFILLKNMLDGGLFNFETPAALCALAVLLLWDTSVLKKCVTFIVSFYLVAYVAIYTLGGFKDAAAFGQTLYQWGALALFVSVLIWLLYSPRVSRQHMLLLIAVSLLLVPSLSTDREMWWYRGTYIPREDGALVGLYHTVSDAQYTLQDTVGNLYVYRLTPANDTTTVGKILYTHRLLDNIHPIAVPWRDCMPTAKPALYIFTMTSRQELAQDVYESPNKSVVVRTQRQDRRSAWYVYSVQVSIQPCMPRHVNLLQEAMQSMGAHTFIFTNFVLE